MILFRCACGLEMRVRPGVPIECVCGKITARPRGAVVDPKPTPRRPPRPAVVKRCPHQGAPTGRVVPCESCAGAIELKVLHCDKFGECVPAIDVGLPVCATCEHHPHQVEASTTGGGVAGSATWLAGRVRVDRRRFIGASTHRAGWPFVMRSIEPLIHRRGILLDDFVEQTYCYSPPIVHREPWVGIFHHPPNFPAIGEDRERPTTFMALDQFRRSLAELRLAIALTEYLAEWLRPRLPCPVAVLKHPTETNVPIWREHSKRLVQVGYYLRNTRAIHQAPVPDGWCKLRIWPDNPQSWVRRWDQRVAEFIPRPEVGTVRDMSRVPAPQFDDLLATSVVLTELLDASANNVVIECLARCTPLVVNRHPAVAEYLGADYPLFFDNIEEVESLLEPATIRRAHQHLASRDRSFLKGGQFAADLARLLASI